MDNCIIDQKSTYKAHNKMEHGGDLLSYKDFYEGELVDFSSNINPLGPPDGLKEVLLKGFDSLEVYPDIEYRKLRNTISQYLGCSRQNVLVGNGAVEIIDNFIIPAQRIVTMVPSFSEYRNRAIVHGKGVITLHYNKDFFIDLADLRSLIQDGDLIILGNPNNPTGLRIEQDKLMGIYGLVMERGAYLLLDEAFYEFCPRDYDSIELFRPYDYESVGIIRAATKFFALPGIRLGYCCASKKRILELGRVALPWSVNALADMAGRFIFKDKDYIERSRAYIQEERLFVLEKLSKIEGIRAYPTHANYILIRSYRWGEEYLFDFFLERGIVIRKCSSFLGLSDVYIRVAVKDRENNKRLVDIFEELGRINEVQL